MQDFIIVLIVLLIIGAVAAYIRSEKKKGVTCVGCPHAKECAAKRAGTGCGGCQQ